MPILSGPANGWVAKDSQDNALATASKAAGGAGVYHYVTGVYASFSAAATKLLQIKDGTTVIWEGYVVNSRDVVFGSPIRIAANAACSAELAASGTVGVVGKVNITGFTD